MTTAAAAKPPKLPTTPPPTLAGGSGAVGAPLSYPGVVFGPTGLELPPCLPFEVWREIVGHVYRNLETYRWAIGDALLFGNAKWGEMYSQAEDETKIDYYRLADYKWVANRVPFSARNEKLSWSHHRCVAKFPVETQVALLTFAEVQGLGVQQLRDHIATMARTRIEDILDQPAREPTPAAKEAAERYGRLVARRLREADPETDALTAEDEAERAATADREAWEPLPRTCPHCGGVL